MSTPRWEREGVGWPLAEHSSFVAAASLRWHIQRLGAGPPLLLMHGTGAATHSWARLAPLLAAHHEIVSLDLPGHGFTTGRPRGGLALPAMARAIAELLNTLGVVPRLIVGHSAGAAIALQMVKDRLADPAGVVGIAPALEPFPGLAGRIFPTLAKLLFVNPLAPHIFAGMARVPGETARFLARSTGSTIPEADAAFYARLFGTSDHCAGAIGMMADWDLTPLAAALPGLGIPLLLIHGAKDSAIPLASAEAVAGRVPGARVEMLADAGHLAHEEWPDRVATLIETFAAEVA